MSAILFSLRKRKRNIRCDRCFMRIYILSTNFRNNVTKRIVKRRIDNKHSETTHKIYDRLLYNWFDDIFHQISRLFLISPHYIIILSWSVNSKTAIIFADCQKVTKTKKYSSHPSFENNFLLWLGMRGFLCGLILKRKF